MAELWSTMKLLILQIPTQSELMQNLEGKSQGNLDNNPRVALSKEKI